MGILSRVVGEKFYAVAEKWIDTYYAECTQKTKTEICLRFQKYVYPVIGDKYIRLINKNQIIQILQAYEKDAPAGGKRLYGNLRRVFLFADAQSHFRIHNPVCESIKLLLKDCEPGAHAFIAPRDMPVFLKRLHARKMNSEARKAIMMLIYTGMRCDECLSAKWSEFDFDEKVLRIPADRMKKRREHIVPLSDPVLEILHSMRKCAVNDYVFSVRSHVLRYHVKAVSDKQVTLHGFRKTFSTAAHESGLWSVDAIELSLAHKIYGVRGVYNRAKYLDERRRLMRWYAAEVEKWLL